MLNQVQHNEWAWDDQTTNMFVLHEPQQSSFEKVGIVGRMFASEYLINNSEYMIITTDIGHETYIKENQSDFVYYILEGSGYFEVNGQKEDCHSGDLVVIPRGNKFIYKGQLKMLLSCTPPWKQEQEVETKE